MWLWTISYFYKMLHLRSLTEFWLIFGKSSFNHCLSKVGCSIHTILNLLILCLFWVIKNILELSLFLVSVFCFLLYKLALPLFYILKSPLLTVFLKSKSISNKVKKNVSEWTFLEQSWYVIIFHILVLLNRLCIYTLTTLKNPFF